MEKKAKKKKRTKADPGILLEPIVKLKMDLRTAAATLKNDEARYLVDLYYQIQDFRKASNSQICAIERAVAKGKRPDEPTLLLGWIFNTNFAVEQIIKKTLEEFTEVEPSGMGVWAKSVFGIGPVLSAGLLAHIDITKVKTGGGIWRFAGLDFTSKWEKKHKRPSPTNFLQWQNMSVVLFSSYHRQSSSPPRCKLFMCPQFLHLTIFTSLCRTALRMFCPICTGLRTFYPVGMIEMRQRIRKRRFFLVHLFECLFIPVGQENFDGPPSGSGMNMTWRQ